VVERAEEECDVDARVRLIEVPRIADDSLDGADGGRLLDVFLDRIDQGDPMPVGREPARMRTGGTANIEYDGRRRQPATQKFLRPEELQPAVAGPGQPIGFDVPVAVEGADERIEFNHLPIVYGGNSRRIPFWPRYAARVVELKREGYPRSNGYDAGWLLDGDMGPHPLWLLEDLAGDLELRAGMRVLDLGSGKGATSVFLAKEYGVQVWAADLWIEPSEASANIASQGVDGVVPVKAEAHALPFAHGFFDAIVCIDAYEYFGTADGYLAYITQFLKPGGQLGVATPALRTEIRDLGYIPDHIKKLVGWEALAWHTADWWRFHWEITELVEVTAARLQESGWQDWLTWAQARSEHCGSRDASLDMLEADQGQYLTFAMLTARKPAA